MSSNWHLVSFKTGQDHVARRGLLDQGFIVYLAKKHEREKIQGRVKVITSLRLSPYGFVLFDRDTDQHGPIQNTRGVAKLFCDREGRPDIIPAGTIDRLRAIEDDEMENAQRKQKSDAIKPGSRIKIDRHDDWKGLEGMVIDNHRGEVHVVIGFIRVVLPEADVSLIPQQC